MHRTRHTGLVAVVLTALCGSALAASWYDDCLKYTDPNDGTGPWVTGTPESQGLNASKLQAGVDRLAADRDVLSVLVVRNNVLVHESYHHGASAKTAVNAHSASKSILAVAVGCLINEGKIPSVDTTVAQLVPQYFDGYSANDVRLQITLAHLLTHTPGLRWAEDASEYVIEDEPGWVQQVFDMGMATTGSGRRGRTPVTPGTRFNYSTGNSHIVSAIIQQVTGLTTEQYINARLLAPLGAETEHWGHDPEGISSGGYNTYLTPRELASFGLMMLNEGKNLKGEQVVPASVVKECLTYRVNNSTYGYGYGYFWRTRTIDGHTIWWADGWGGQEVYIVPDLKLVFVTTADTATNGSEADHEGFVEDYLIPSTQGTDDGDDDGDHGYHHGWHHHRRRR